MLESDTQPHAPFQTQNLSLSITLFTCNVPFMKNEKGKIVPLYNIYDINTLRRLGYKGWDIEQAAEDAFKRKLPGQITYNFQGTEDCHEIVKAWDVQSDIISKSDALAKETGDFQDNTAELDNIPASMVARICCQYAKNRLTLRNQWLQVRPMFVLYGEFRHEREGDKVVAIGSLKAMTVGASQKIRDKIKI